MTPSAAGASSCSADLALLHISAPTSKLHPLALADSSTVKIGDGVVAIGDQFGLTDTVTSGIVSALNRTITSPNNTPITNAIQTDAAINHGSSGGPLLNMQGQLVGVTAQIESDSDGNNGVAFAIRRAPSRSLSPSYLRTHNTARHRASSSVRSVARERVSRFRHSATRRTTELPDNKRRPVMSTSPIGTSDQAH